MNPLEQKGDSSSNADLTLIRRFIDGDIKAFDEIVLKYQKVVFNLCYRMLGNYSEAEDTAQEVFVKVYRSLKGFRGHSRFSTWIHSIASNICLNRIKYLKRRRYFKTRSLSNPSEAEDGKRGIEISNGSGNPEGLYENKEIQVIVQKHINLLKEEHRLILIMRDIQGLSYEEIADILRTPEGTVKSKLHRARMELKQGLEKYFIMD